MKQNNLNSLNSLNNARTFSADAAHPGSWDLGTEGWPKALICCFKRYRNSRKQLAMPGVMFYIFDYF